MLLCGTLCDLLFQFTVPATELRAILPPFDSGRFQSRFSTRERFRTSSSTDMAGKPAALNLHSYLRVQRRRRVTPGTVTEALSSVPFLSFSLLCSVECCKDRLLSPFFFLFLKEGRLLKFPATYFDNNFCHFTDPLHHKTPSSFLTSSSIVITPHGIQMTTIRSIYKYEIRGNEMIVRREISR